MRKPLEYGIIVLRFSASIKPATVCYLYSLLSRPLIRDAAFVHINISWGSYVLDYKLGDLVWGSARYVWMEILLEEATSQSRLSIDGGSLAEVLRGLGPSIFDEFRVARFVDWLEKRVSDHVPLTRGCTKRSHCLGLF